MTSHNIITASQNYVVDIFKSNSGYGSNWVDKCKNRLHTVSGQGAGAFLIG